MKFDLETTGLYRLKKHNHNLIKEALIYRDKKFSTFGLVEINSFWSFIHIPSERVIISQFETKYEAEEFWDVLAECVDLDSLVLCNPKFEEVQEQIEFDIEIAYKKYRMRKDLRL